MILGQDFQQVLQLRLYQRELKKIEIKFLI